MFHWILDGRTEADLMKARSRLELPPPGYTGSLKGTNWDPDRIIAGYQ